MFHLRQFGYIEFELTSPLSRMRDLFIHTYIEHMTQQLINYSLGSPRMLNNRTCK